MLHPGWANATRPRSRLSGANRVTDHLGVPFPGAGAPKRLAAAVGTAGLCQRRGSRRRAETTEGGRWGPLTAPPPDAPGGLRRRRLCPPPESRQPGLRREPSVFPTPVARGSAGAASRCAAAPGRRTGWGLRGARGRWPQPQPRAGEGTAGAAAVRSALAPASPAEKGGTAGAPARQTARAAAVWAATASRAPGKPPPAPPQSGWGEELTELWPPTRRAPDAGSRPPRGCKVAGSAPRALSLLTLRWGTGQVAGVSGGGSGQLPSSHLGAGEWGPGGGGDGSWASPPPRPSQSPANPPFPPGGGALATPLSFVDLLPPPPPANLPPPRSSGAGWGSPPDFSHQSSCELWVQP